MVILLIAAAVAFAGTVYAAHRSYKNFRKQMQSEEFRSRMFASRARQPGKPVPNFGNPPRVYRTETSRAPEYRPLDEYPTPTDLAPYTAPVVDTQMPFDFGSTPHVSIDHSSSVDCTTHTHVDCGSHGGH